MWQFSSVQSRKAVRYGCCADVLLSLLLRRRRPALSQRLKQVTSSHREVAARPPAPAGDLGHRAGSQNVTVVPRPTTLCARMRPPCASTSARVIASPSPLPPAARLRAASAR
jgi:hypothetical protein